MADFLLEIGCEEIPARMIAGAMGELRERVGALLQRERLAPEGEMRWLDTPRRLAVMAAGIPAAQPDVTEQVTGPSAQVGYPPRLVPACRSPLTISASVFLRKASAAWT